MTLKIKHRFILPSGHSIGPTLFGLFIICLILTASYLYFAGRSIIPSGDLTASALPSNDLGLVFTHPLYGYSLNLPFGWRERYQVTEEGNRTNFNYLPPPTGSSAHLPIPLFSIAVLEENTRDLNGEKIGAQGRRSFWLEMAGPIGAPSGEDKEAWQEMAAGIPAVGQSFKMILTEQETDLRKFIAQELNLVGTTSLPLLAYDTLATAETGSSTKVYLWLAALQYTWQGNDMVAAGEINMPLVVVWQKNGQTISSRPQIIMPRSGRHYESDLKKMFPDSITQNSIFKNGTPEHLALRQELSDELKSSASVYFGGSPILTKYGRLTKFNEDNGNLVVAVDEVGVEIKPAGASVSSTRPIKCVPTAVSCRSGDYVIKNGDQSVYRYTVASDTPVALAIAASSSESHISAGPMSLADFVGAFRATSTSPLKDQIYRLSLLDGRVVRINSI